MVRPVRGGIRLKGPYWPSPRGPRVQARKISSSLNTLPAHTKGYGGHVCRLVSQNKLVSQIAKTLNTQTSPFPVQTQKCALSGKVGEATCIRPQTLTGLDFFADGDEHDYEEVVERFQKTL